MSVFVSKPISRVIRKISREQLYVLLIFITSGLLLSSTLSHFITVPDAMWLKDAAHFTFPELFKLNALKTFRPVYSVYLFLSYRVFGMYLPAYYLTNLLLHAANGVLVYAVTKKLVRGSLLFYREAALLGGLFFAVLFSHYQALLVLCNVHDMLMTLFCLLSFLFFINYLETENHFAYGVSIVFFVSALLTKEPALFFPVAVFPAFFLIPHPDTKAKFSVRSFKIMLPYFAVMAVYALHYVTMVYPEQNKDLQRFVMLNPAAQALLNADSLSELLLSSFSVIRDPYYLRYESFFPALRAVLAVNRVFLFFFSGCAAWLCFLLKARPPRRLLWLLLFSSGWVVVNFFPTTFSGEAVWKDFVFAPRFRYFYLPSVGLSWILAIMVVFSYEQFERRFPFARVIPVAAALCFLCANFLSTHIMSYGYGVIKQNYKAIVDVAGAACRGRCGNGALYFVDFPDGYKMFYGLGPKPFVDLIYKSNVTVAWVGHEDLKRLRMDSGERERSYFIRFSGEGKTLYDSTSYYRMSLWKTGKKKETE